MTACDANKRRKKEEKSKKNNFNYSVDKKNQKNYFVDSHINQPRHEPHWDEAASSEKQGSRSIWDAISFITAMMRSSGCGLEFHGCSKLTSWQICVPAARVFSIIEPGFFLVRVFSGFQIPRVFSLPAMDPRS